MIGFSQPDRYAKKQTDDGLKWIYINRTFSEAQRLQ
jgi:hypothetical protein